MKNFNYIQFLFDYGTLMVLAGLCCLFSYVTIEEQSPTNTASAEQLVKKITKELSANSNIIVLARKGSEGEKFSETITKNLTQSGFNVSHTIIGQPADARKALTDLGSKGTQLHGIAADKHMAIFANSNLGILSKTFPNLANAKIFQPNSYYWPNFLKRENLLNVMKQISVVAIIAIGMTMIIITAGIDLSVGSLIAFSGVITALAIQSLGGDNPAIWHLWMGAMSGAIVCGLIGMFTGGLVTIFRIPAFIATLGIMFIAKGLAFIFSDSAPVPIANEAFGWLGRGRTFFGLPNSVILMLALFFTAHILMTRTSIGRYIYAVGGNPEAARLSGVPVKLVLVFVYTLTGLLAGLGGVMEASLHITGDPKSGDLVELKVIAAVVVGGTSLAGGQGRILGTLIGAFIIAVINNGMNLTGVESHMQKVIYGAVILVAVLIDQLKIHLMKLKKY
jgi:ribose transport system permease protein|tara:strand:- start:210 stop:1556 length:1347 start_codon:yes stop_codon:yes gene_type:complete